MTKQDPKPVTCTTIDTPAGLCIRVSTDPPSWRGIIALGPPLYFIYIGITGFKVLAGMPDPPWQHPLYAVLDLGLVFVGLSAIVGFLWAMVAYDSILLTPSELVLSKVLFGMGPRHRYPIAEVDDLHVVYHDETRVKKGALVFNAGSKQVFFGKGLSPKQAAEVLRTFGTRSEIRFRI